MTVFAAAVVTHGNIKLPEWLERLLQPVVITLDLHLIHHSISDTEANANFGAIFSVWDRLFGTSTDFPERDRTRSSSESVSYCASTASNPGRLMTPWLMTRAPPGAADG